MRVNNIITQANKFIKNNLVKKTDKNLKKIFKKQKEFLIEFFDKKFLNVFKQKKGQLELFDVDFIKNINTKKSILKRKTITKSTSKQLELFI